MTKMAPAIDLPRDERRVANHELNIQESDRAVSTALANGIADAWMLAIYFSIFNYSIVESIVRHNAEAITAVTYALGSADVDDKCEEKRSRSVEDFDSQSVGNLLASDRRSIVCKAFGGAFGGNLTKSLRRDLILASSVVC